jgi:hypothetical protein
MQCATAVLGILSIVVVVTAVQQGTATSTEMQKSLEGRLLPTHMRGAVPWKTITAQQMDSGTTAPASTNVIIQIPDDSPNMTLDVLTGYRGESVRFWGYCFPENFDRAVALRRRGFPGTVFLSRKEREVRRQQQMNLRQDRFSVFKDFDEDDLNQDRFYRGQIRHQQEIFRGGTSCYLMSDAPLPIGTDRDNDFANAAVERDSGSDDKNPDTDADGVLDGLEIFYLGTSPVLRDTDGDGLIDGVEDRNKNGRRDLDETDPTKWDTDKDGLCDGLCKVEKGQKLRGEDKNLNGVLDAGEFDPLKVDTDDDGVGDLHEVYLCELGGGTNC